RARNQNIGNFIVNRDHDSQKEPYSSLVIPILLTSTCVCHRKDIIEEAGPGGGVRSEKEESKGLRNLVLNWIGVCDIGNRVMLTNVFEKLLLDNCNSLRIISLDCGVDDIECVDSCELVGRRLSREK